MDARTLGVPYGLGATVDILHRRPRKAGDSGLPGPLGDLGNRPDIAPGGDRETGLDDIDAHFVQELRDLEFFLESHGRARALLAVAQGGIEDEHAILVAALAGLVGHGTGPSPGSRPFMTGIQVFAPFP